MVGGLLTIHDSIKHFIYYLEGRDFSFQTDYKPLTYAFQKKTEEKYIATNTAASSHL